MKANLKPLPPISVRLLAIDSCIKFWKRQSYGDKKRKEKKQIG